MNKHIIRHVTNLLIIATLYTSTTMPINLQTEPIKLARGGFRGGGFGRSGFGRGDFRHREGFRQQRWRHQRPVNGRRDHRHPGDNRYYYGGNNVYGAAVDNDSLPYWAYGAAVSTAAASADSQQNINLQQENERLRQHISDLQSQIDELRQSKKSEDDDEDDDND